MRGASQEPNRLLIVDAMQMICYSKCTSAIKPVVFSYEEGQVTIRRTLREYTVPRPVVPVELLYLVCCFENYRTDSEPLTPDQAATNGRKRVRSKRRIYNTMGGK